MSIAQYADLLVCPAHIAEAARQTRQGLNILINQKAFLESFSINDAAALAALNTHPVVQRYLGFTPMGVRFTWGIKSDAESNQFHKIEELAKASSIAAELESNYLQPPAADNDKPLFSVEDLGNGIVVLVVHPGALFTMRNDNYLMTVLRAVVERMFGFVPLDNLFQFTGSSGDLVKRYLNLAAFTNVNRPPQPVFG